MFWKRKAKQVESAGRGFCVPAGQRVYAIGDIHGRDDLFAQMIDLIRADHAARAPAELMLVLLGDLVDRGPESSQVVERAIQLRAEFPGMRFLIGNHEECFLAALTGNVRRLRYFMRIGGDATVQSYWPEGESFADASFEEVAERLPGLVPQSHIDFMGNGEDMVEIGDYLFVHAGIRPGVPLEKQTIADLRWIREDFLDHLGDYGKMVVHGHSISARPDEQLNRIGVDIGAFRTGALACLALEGSQRWFIVAEADAAVEAAAA